MEGGERERVCVCERERERESGMDGALMENVRNVEINENIKYRSSAAAPPTISACVVRLLRPLLLRASPRFVLSFDSHFV